MAWPGDLLAAPGGVSFGDDRLRLDVDGDLRTRAALRGRHFETRWCASENLRLAGGKVLERFPLAERDQETLSDELGAGTRVRLRGTSAEGVEKALELRLYDRYPGFAFVRVRYRNTAARPLAITGWASGAYAIDAAGERDPAFWSYSGASYSDRRNWLQPVKAGFHQDNFMGMSSSDYGGGTPVVDVWRRDGGLAVGHVDVQPRLVSLPIHAANDGVRIAVSADQEQVLAPGAVLEPPETFVCVHEGDYFRALDMYRRVMADRGLRAPVPPAASYEPIWCAWGYERSCTPELIATTLPKAKELGLEWAVIDDGWQSNVGDWRPNRQKYPHGEEDLRNLVGRIRAAGMKPRLWWAPLAVAPGADLLHDHPDMLLLDKDGVQQNVTWWNSFTLCPAYGPTIEYTRELVRRFLGEWGFAGLKVDGQHFNGVAPCFNPAHHHARPEESVEGLHELYRVIYETARGIDPQAVVEVCPCGTAYAFHNFPYMNQAPASDPESSWQVRLKGKTLKALMGPSAPYAGDHVELSDHGTDFASTVGVGAVVSTKFTWPMDPKPKDSYLLTPEREQLWRKWVAIYRDRMLPTGSYRGELYDIGFDKPETHVVEKDGVLHYAFYAPHWHGAIALRGLGKGRYRVTDYVAGRDLGSVTAQDNRLEVQFEGALLVAAVPA